MSDPRSQEMKAGLYIESEVSSDVTILEVLKRARYTIQDEDEGFELLFLVAFPSACLLSMKGQRLALPLSWPQGCTMLCWRMAILSSSSPPRTSTS